MSRGEKQFRKKSLREILFGRNYFEGAIQEILSGGIRDFLDVHEDPGNKKAHPPAPSGSKWMCYVIPIVHAMLLRQDMKKARLPTQAPLWVTDALCTVFMILCCIVF